ncbi:MAG: sigma-70 family RNA polymerase sigma factor [Planctomycetaceae bacterium]|nr:sigma-70 family RNA polymerase sigma factor [Planctomycetaceae bacterium]
MLSHNDVETADNSDLNALRAGGRDALAEIFQQMQPSLHRMLRLRLGRMSKREDESDVLQNTWLEAARRLDEYLADPRVSVTVWLRRITRQVFTRMWRTHMTTEMRSMDREQPLQKIAFDDSGDALATELSASMPSPASVIIQQEMKERLRELIADMPDGDREILALRHLESLSIRDTADELNIGLEAASKRYQRAILKLSRAFGSPDR